jgi:hypothetical protein
MAATVSHPLPSVARAPLTEDEMSDSATDRMQFTKDAAVNEDGSLPALVTPVKVLFNHGDLSSFQPLLSTILSVISSVAVCAVCAVLAAVIFTLPPTSLQVRLPPLRLCLELSVAAAVGGALNLAIVTVVVLCDKCRHRLWAVVLLLPLPYCAPSNLSFGTPFVAVSLSLWISVWKCLDFAAGTAPPGICTSLPAKLAHFLVPVEYRIATDGSPVRVSGAEWRPTVVALAMTLVRRLVSFALLLCLFAFERPLGDCDLVPALTLASTPRSAPPFTLQAALQSPALSAVFASSLTYLHGLLVSYGNVWVIFHFLAISSDALSLALAVAGFAPCPTFHQPLTRGTSPSDFWGRRWNLLIHGLFRRSIFQPLRRRGVPAAAAAAGAFVVSGLFHEYCFMSPPAARVSTPLSRPVAWSLTDASRADWVLWNWSHHTSRCASEVCQCGVPRNGSVTSRAGSCVRRWLLGRPPLPSGRFWPFSDCRCGHPDTIATH